MKKKLLSTLAAVSMLTNVVTPVLAAPPSHAGDDHYSYATGYEGDVTEAEFLADSYSIQNGKTKNLLDELMAYVSDSLLAHELRNVEWFVENHDSNYPFSLISSKSGVIECGFDSGTATLKAVITRTDGKVVTASTTLVAAPRIVTYATGFSMDTTKTLLTGNEAIHDEVITIKPTPDNAIFSYDQATAIRNAVATGDLNVYLRQNSNMSTTDSTAKLVAPVTANGSAVSWNGYTGVEDIDVIYQVGEENYTTGDFEKGALSLVIPTGTSMPGTVSVEDGYYVNTATKNQIAVGGVAIKANTDTSNNQWLTESIVRDIVNSLNDDGRYSVSYVGGQPLVHESNSTTAGAPLVNSDYTVIDIVINNNNDYSPSTIKSNIDFLIGGVSSHYATSYYDYTLAYDTNATNLAAYNNSFTITAGDKVATIATNANGVITDTNGLLNLLESSTLGNSNVNFMLWDANTRNNSVGKTFSNETTIEDLRIRAYDVDATSDNTPNFSSFVGTKVTVESNGTIDDGSITFNSANVYKVYTPARNWTLTTGMDGSDNTTIGHDLINVFPTTATSAYDYTLHVTNFPRYTNNVRTDNDDDVARTVRVNSKPAVQPDSLHQTSSITVTVGDIVNLVDHFKVNSTTNTNHDIVYNEAYFNNDGAYAYNDYAVITDGDEILGVREGKNKVVASVWNSYDEKTHYAEIVVTVVPRTGISTTVTPTSKPLTVTASATTLSLGGSATQLVTKYYGETEFDVNDNTLPTVQSSTNGNIEDLVFYKSSNPAVLSVNDDGLVSPIGAGTATITAYIPNSDYEATINLTVVAPTITTPDSNSGNTSVPATAVASLGQLF